jgi:hypothetical protein
VVFGASACTSGVAPATPPPGSALAASQVDQASGAPGATPSATPAATPRPAAYARNPAPIVEGQTYAVKIDPADFGAGVDHPFLPLTPGTTFTFDGAEKVVVTVTDDAKVILGVPVTVVRDQVLVDGALAEDTFDWYAQDRDGNVWYFGEQTAEYENGKVTSTKGSWEGGVDGAQPGIVMLADPRIGDSYRQEYLAGEAEDLAKVTGIDGSISVPYGAYEQVLITEEWTPLEPDVRERKTYARGVGLLESRQVKGGDEVVQLTAVKTGP